MWCRPIDGTPGLTSEIPTGHHRVTQEAAEAAVVQRRCRIAEAALERDFELAFRLIGDYRLPAEQIYTAVARRLARAKAKPSLIKLLRDVGATITDAERDEVVSQEALAHGRTLNLTPTLNAPCPLQPLTCGLSFILASPNPIPGE